MEYLHICYNGPFLNCHKGNSPVYSLLTLSELVHLRAAADATLKRYEEIGLESDDEVREQNDRVYREWEQKMKERRRLNKDIEKEKTLDTRNLYLIHNTVQNTLKIGISVNPKARLSTLQLSTGDKLALIFDIKGKAYLEKELHKEFANLRLSSEWFRYDPKIIKRFTELQWD